MELIEFSTYVVEKIEAETGVVESVHNPAVSHKKLEGKRSLVLPLQRNFIVRVSACIT